MLVGQIVHYYKVKKSLNVTLKVVNQSCRWNPVQMECGAFHTDLSSSVTFRNIFSFTPLSTKYLFMYIKLKIKKYTGKLFAIKIFT